MTKLTSVVLALAVASPAFGVDETGRKDESPAASENGKGLSAIAYVRSDPYHGVNYTAAHSFGPEAVPMLLRMLEDEREKVHWANIITALGMIADPEATGPLIDFLERRFKGDVDSSTWQALLAVAPSLGFLATDPQSKAFLYLRDGSRRRFWETRDLLWTYPTLGSGEREILLTKLAINGLGIAANSEAEEALRSLSAEMSKNPNEWAFYRGNVDDALATIDKVRQLGHDGAFGKDTR